MATLLQAGVNLPHHVGEAPWWYQNWSHLKNIDLPPAGGLHEKHEICRN